MNYPHPSGPPRFTPSPQSPVYAPYRPCRPGRDSVESPLPEVVTPSTRTSPLRFETPSFPASADVEKSQPPVSRAGASTTPARSTVLGYSKRRLWILLAVILVILLCLAAGLGVVLSRRAQHGAEGEASTSPVNTATPQPPGSLCEWHYVLQCPRLTARRSSVVCEAPSNTGRARARRLDVPMR